MMLPDPTDVSPTRTPPIKPDDNRGQLPYRLRIGCRHADPVFFLTPSQHPDLRKHEDRDDDQEYTDHRPQHLVYPFAVRPLECAQSVETDQRTGQAADRQKEHHREVDRLLPEVDNPRSDLCDRSERRVGADGRQRRHLEHHNEKGEQHHCPPYPRDSDERADKESDEYG